MLLRRCILIAALLVSAISISAQTEPEANGEIRSLVHTMLEAQRNYDSPRLNSVFTTDFIEISPLGEVDSREKVLGFYSPAEKKKMDGVKVTVEASDYSIRQYDEFAIVIVRLTFNVEAKGMAMPPREMRATIVCRKGNVGWKIASAHYTGIRENPKKPA